MQPRFPRICIGRYLQRHGTAVLVGLLAKGGARDVTSADVHGWARAGRPALEEDAKKSLGKRVPGSCRVLERSTMASLFRSIREYLAPPPLSTMDAVKTSLPAVPKHPYFPSESPIAGYLANEYNTLELVSLFAAGCAVIFSCTYVTVKKVRPSLPLSDLVVILWFTLCGFIHLFFEGYYAYNFRTIGGHQDLFGQLWKEYSLSDSRYLTADSAFVLCMESITAVSRFHRPCHTVADKSDRLGPALLPHGCSYCRRPSAPALFPDHRVARPTLRRRPLLRHELV